MEFSDPTTEATKKAVADHLRKYVAEAAEIFEDAVREGVDDAVVAVIDLRDRRALQLAEEIGLLEEGLENKVLSIGTVGPVWLFSLPRTMVRGLLKDKFDFGVDMFAHCDDAAFFPAIDFRFGGLFLCSIGRVPMQELVGGLLTHERLEHCYVDPAFRRESLAWEIRVHFL